jgi:hypothetical protein
MTAETRELALAEVIGRQQAVIDASIDFVDARRQYLKLRVSSANGLAIVAARRRRDDAIDTLTAAVEELDR